MHQVTESRYPHLLQITAMDDLLLVPAQLCFPSHRQSASRVTGPPTPGTRARRSRTGRAWPGRPCPATQASAAPHCGRTSAATRTATSGPGASPAATASSTATSRPARPSCPAQVRAAQHFSLRLSPDHPPTPLFILSTRHPRSPDALCELIWAWWTSSTGHVADLVSPV